MKYIITILMTTMFAVSVNAMTNVEKGLKVNELVQSSANGFMMKPNFKEILSEAISIAETIDGNRTHEFSIILQKLGPTRECGLIEAYKHELDDTQMALSSYWIDMGCPGLLDGSVEYEAEYVN